ncbi:hypothetical protein COOONC_09722 [Cooperia oncophora]
MKWFLLLICVEVALALWCESNGRLYSNGEVWIWGRFKVTCVVEKNEYQEGWHTEVLACLTARNTPVAVGHTLIEDGQRYQCIKQHNGAGLHVTTV